MEIASTQLAVDRNPHGDDDLLDVNIDILSIFSLIDKFLNVWVDECELIDLENDQLYHEKEQPEEQSSAQVRQEEERKVEQTPPKDVTNKMQETLNQYMELLANLPADDPTAITYQEIIKTLQSKISEIEKENLSPKIIPKKEEPNLNDREESYFSNIKKEEIEHFPPERESPFIRKNEHKAMLENYGSHTRKITEEPPTVDMPASEQLSKIYIF